MLAGKFMNLRAHAINNCRWLVLAKRTNSTQDAGPKSSTPPKSSSTNVESDIVHLDDREDIRIPEYPTRHNEPLEKRRQRLLYQSRKRGMLENDLLLSTFAAKYLRSMSEEHVVMYDKLINKPSNDWDIYNWATGSKPTPPEYENEIMTMFQKHVKNEMKEKRLRMPDL